MSCKAGRVSSGNVLFVGLSILALLLFYSGNADAFSQYYVDRGCAGCHGATPTTCDGCHHHGSSGLQAATDKGTYTPGEALSVTFDGGSQTGWIRAILYNQDNVEVARFAGTGNPPQGRSGTNSGFPILFNTTAPTTPGTYTYQAAWFGNSTNGAVPITHGEVRVSTNSFTVSASTAPTISTPSPLPAGTVGTAYDQPLAATGGTLPYSWSVTAGSSLPAGLSLSAAGVLSGTPTAAGTFNFSITVTGGGTASKDFALTINPVGAPTITTASPLPTGKVGTAYNQALAATGGTTPYSWSVSAGALPAGLSLSAAGVLSGTPTAAGTFSFTVQVTGGGTSTRDFDLTIDAASVVFWSGGGDGGSGCAISPSGGGNGGILGTYGPLILLALGIAVRKRARGRKEEPSQPA